MARRPTITVSVKERVNHWKKISKELRKAKGRRPHVKIGVQGPKGTAKKKSQFTSLGELTVADIATFHEFGGDPGPPERSFLRSTMDKNREQYIQLCDKLRSEMVTGKLTMKKALALLGERIVADVKNTIREGIPPELAQSTIDRKGSSTPLIDTGQLINSITYVVDMGGALEE